MQLRKHPANVQAVRVNFNPEERSVACTLLSLSLFLIDMMRCAQEIRIYRVTSDTAHCGTQNWQSRAIRKGARPFNVLSHACHNAFNKLSSKLSCHTFIRISFM